MFSAFLDRAKGIVGFEAEHGVRPRSTPMGFTLPDYGQGEAGMLAWEATYGETARAAPGSIPFSLVSDVASLLDLAR